MLKKTLDFVNVKQHIINLINASIILQCYSTKYISFILVNIIVNNWICISDWHILIKTPILFLAASRTAAKVDKRVQGGVSSSSTSNSIGVLAVQGAWAGATKWVFPAKTFQVPLYLALLSWRLNDLKLHCLVRCSRLAYVVAYTQSCERLLHSAFTVNLVEDVNNYLCCRPFHCSVHSYTLGPCYQYHQCVIVYVTLTHTRTHTRTWFDALPDKPFCVLW